MHIRKSDTSIMGRAMRHVSALTVIYILLVLVLPADKRSMQIYHLSASGYHALLFSVALPALLVWYAGFYAYAKLSEYSELLHGSDEGNSFAHLAKGVKFLAWSYPLWLIITLIVTSISNEAPGFFPSAWAISNYTQMLLPVIAFGIVGGAARQLLRHNRINVNSADAKYLMLSFVVGGVLYCYLIFRHFSSTTLTSSDNLYLLPVWLVIATIIMPYLYSWFVGLFAAWEIDAYSKHVSGVLYRQPLRFLVAGIVVVILSIIAFQYVSSLELASRYLKLGSGLVGMQLFALTRGIGFVLIAIGASRLKRIEEI